MPRGRRRVDPAAARARPPPSVLRSMPIANSAPTSAPIPAPPTLRTLLHQAPWFDGLDAAQQARVEVDMFERAVGGGAFVGRRGDPPDYWMGIIDGLVNVSNVSSDGKLATLTGMSNGSWFGEGTLLKKECRKFDVVALRDTRLAMMPMATFDWLLAHSLRFNRFLLDHVNERLGQFIATVEHDRMLDPDARVARCLGSMVHPLLYPANGHSLRIAQEEIGQLAGVSRQRVNQALQRLEAERLVAIEYGGVRIVDLEGLRRFGS